MNEISLSGRIAAGPTSRNLPNGNLAVELQLEFRNNEHVRIFALNMAAREIQNFVEDSFVMITGRLVVNPENGRIEILAAGVKRWAAAENKVKVKRRAYKVGEDNWKISAGEFSRLSSVRGVRSAWKKPGPEAVTPGDAA